MYKFVLLLVCLFLQACLHNSPEQLKSASKGGDVVVIQTDKNYEDAYRIISKQAKACWRADVGYGKSRVVRSELKPESELGLVYVYYDDWVWGDLYDLWVEIQGQKEKSQITLYKASSILNPGQYPDSIKSWLNGGAGC